MLPGFSPRLSSRFLRGFARLPRWGVVLAAFVVSVGVPGVARAWVEVHVAGDEARVTVERSGAARVQHKVTLKINGGPLRAFDVAGVDPDAAPEADAYVVPLKDAQRSSLASASPVVMEMLPREKPRDDGSLPPPVLRARFDGKGLGRGVYVLFFRYKTELGQRSLLREEGAMTRLTWSGPVWDDGLDTMRTVFQVPAAPTEPRLDEAAGAPEDEGLAPPMTLSTVRRGREHDELELVRPYAPKGEAVRWALLADARAFKPVVEAPKAGPALPVRAFEAATAWTPDREKTLYAVAAVALFAVFTGLVAAKVREVSRVSEAAGVSPRPLVPMPLLARAPLAGATLVAGVTLELILKSGTAGAVLVAAATALCVHRTPVWPRGAMLRGPGKWLPVAEAEALRMPPRPRGVLLDVSTRAGKGLFVVLLGALGAGVWFAWQRSPYHAQLLGLDVVALLGLFCTGRLGELPPDPAAAPIPLLREVSRRVKRGLKGVEARVVGRIRVPDGTPDADEIRLGIAPRAALPGFVGIEVGVVYAPGAGGALAMPEVLLRVTAGSPCEEAVLRLAVNARAARGRRPEERVLSFTPRLPTARMTAAIAAALARAVVAPEPVKETPQKDARGRAQAVAREQARRSPKKVATPAAA
ncbi:hypothetical protein [Chondromyces apiculatus]|uniref:Uncharacterized protein n=1 Tax=Chondromyces apiculatus DSM 436 TaxID=1192034 RepID=A0A017SV38_9BACT|nr:hypothetical protein [Chondromyces apiculatus]EYF00151.1 Hypothetical protein CAP_1138 [Chondromyces apiculatus DSM 436]